MHKRNAYEEWTMRNGPLQHSNKRQQTKPRYAHPPPQRIAVNDWKSHVDPVNIDPDSCGIYEEESDQAQGAPSWLARDFQTMLSNGLRCFPECQLL